MNELLSDDVVHWDADELDSFTLDPLSKTFSTRFGSELQVGEVWAFRVRDGVMWHALVTGLRGIRNSDVVTVTSLLLYDLQDTDAHSVRLAHAVSEERASLQLKGKRRALAAQRYLCLEPMYLNSTHFTVPVAAEFVDLEQAESSSARVTVTMAPKGTLTHKVNYFVRSAFIFTTEGVRLYRVRAEAEEQSEDDWQHHLDHALHTAGVLSPLLLDGLSQEHVFGFVVDPQRNEEEPKKKRIRSAAHEPELVIVIPRLEAKCATSQLVVDVPRVYFESRAPAKRALFVGMRTSTCQKCAYLRNERNSACQVSYERLRAATVEVRACVSRDDHTCSAACSAWNTLSGLRQALHEMPIVVPFEVFEGEELDKDKQRNFFLGVLSDCRVARGMCCALSTAMLACWYREDESAAQIKEILELAANHTWPSQRELAAQVRLLLCDAFSSSDGSSLAALLGWGYMHHGDHHDELYRLGCQLLEVLKQALHDEHGGWSLETPALPDWTAVYLFLRGALIHYCAALNHVPPVHQQYVDVDGYALTIDVTEVLADPEASIFSTVSLFSSGMSLVHTKFGLRDRRHVPRYPGLTFPFAVYGQTQTVFARFCGNPAAEDDTLSNLQAKVYYQLMLGLETILLNVVSLHTEGSPGLSTRPFTCGTFSIDGVYELLDVSATVQSKRNNLLQHSISDALNLFVRKAAKFVRTFLELDDLTLILGFREVGSKWRDNHEDRLVSALSIFSGDTLSNCTTQLVIDVASNITLMQPASGTMALFLDHTLLHAMVGNARMATYDAMAVQSSKNVRFENAAAAAVAHEVEQIEGVSVGVLQIYNAALKKLRGGKLARENIMFSDKIPTLAHDLRRDSSKSASTKTLLSLANRSLDTIAHAEGIATSARLRLEVTATISAPSPLAAIQRVGVVMRAQRALVDSWFIDRFPPVFVLNAVAFGRLWCSTLLGSSLSCAMLLAGKDRLDSLNVAAQLQAHDLLLQQLAGNPRSAFSLSPIEERKRALFFSAARGFPYPLGEHQPGTFFLFPLERAAPLAKKLLSLDDISGRQTATHQLQNAAVQLELQTLTDWKAARALAKLVVTHVELLTRTLCSHLLVDAEHATSLVLALCGKHVVLCRLLSQLTAAKSPSPGKGRLQLVLLLLRELFNKNPSSPLPAAAGTAANLPAGTVAIQHVSQRLLEGRVVPQLLALTLGETNGVVDRAACLEWLTRTMKPLAFPKLFESGASSVFRQVDSWYQCSGYSDIDSRLIANHAEVTVQISRPTLDIHSLSALEKKKLRRLLLVVYPEPLLHAIWHGDEMELEQEIDFAIVGDYQEDSRLAAQRAAVVPMVEEEQESSDARPPLQQQGAIALPLTPATTTTAAAFGKADAAPSPVTPVDEVQWQNSAASFHESAKKLHKRRKRRKRKAEGVSHEVKAKPRLLFEAREEERPALGAERRDQVQNEMEPAHAVVAVNHLSHVFQAAPASRNEVETCLKCMLMLYNKERNVQRGIANKWKLVSQSGMRGLAALACRLLALDCDTLPFGPNDFEISVQKESLNKRSKERRMATSGQSKIEPGTVEAVYELYEASY